MNFWKDKERRRNFIRNAAVVFLLALAAFLSFSVFRAQNIKSDDFSYLLSGTGVESVFENPSDVDDENITKAFWEYTSPEYIVVNREGNRDIAYSSTDSYKVLAPPSMEIVRGMYASVTEEKVIENADEWKNMLSVNSVLLHFPAEISPIFPMQFLGVDQSPITDHINSYSDILVVTGMPEQKTAIIYIKEAETEKIVRFETTLKTESLNRAINSLKNISDKNYAFGYELRLDGYHGNTTRINSMLTIPLVNIETTDMKSEVPEQFLSKLSEVGQNELSNNVLGIFGFDPRTVRSYADKNETRILLDGTRKIELSRDGIIKFSTESAESGIDISGGTVQTRSNSLYVAISGTVKTVLGMFEITGTDIKNADYEIKLTDMSASSDMQSEINLSFDYYINGLVMEYVDYPDSHAIEAVISDGKLVYFKMELKNFVKTKETTKNEPMFDAIDRYCSRLSGGGNIYIRDSYLYYGYKQNNEKMTTKWKVR